MLEEVVLDTPTPKRRKEMTTIGLAYGFIAVGYTVGAIGYLILSITHG